MRERIAHVWEPYTDAAGAEHWPKEDSDRNSLASRLLGACIASCMDSWMEDALDVLRNPEPSSERLRQGVNEHDATDRRVFATLTEEQRTRIESLLFKTVFGVLFSHLVKLDQFPGGVADITIADVDTGELIASAGEGDMSNLHERLLTWVEEFSEFASAYVSPYEGGGRTSG